MLVYFFLKEHLPFSQRLTLGPTFFAKVSLPSPTPPHLLSGGGEAWMHFLQQASQWSSAILCQNETKWHIWELCWLQCPAGCPWFYSKRNLGKKGSKKKLEVQPLQQMPGNSWYLLQRLHLHQPYRACICFDFFCIVEPTLHGWCAMFWISNHFFQRIPFPTIPMKKVSFLTLFSKGFHLLFRL